MGFLKPSVVITSIIKILINHTLHFKVKLVLLIIVDFPKKWFKLDFIKE